MAYSIGIDVGGTKVAAGVLDERGRRVDEIKYPSDPTDSEAMFELLVSIIQTFQSQYDISGAGVALPSFIDKAQRYVYTTANLNWNDEPLVDRLEQRLGLPILLDNDANAAGWAEFSFGAGRGHDDGLMLTIGTGVGGAVILNGELYRGGFGLAGEPGHMRLVPGGRPCGCGARGCLEQYASGSALTRAARELADSDNPLGAGLAAIQAKHGQLTGGLIHQALRDGDPGAASVIVTTGDYVGQGIASIASIIDPEVVVIGGGVAATGELFYSAIVDGYRNNLPSAGKRPELSISLAELGNAAGWIGAADLIRRRLDD